MLLSNLREQRRFPLSFDQTSEMKNEIDIFHQGRREEVRDNQKHTNKPGNMAGTWALKGGTDKRTDERTDERMDERTNEQTENLPILQDFLPYWGRCPKTRWTT